MGWFYLVFGFIMFIALILIHEWGHYIVARRNGVEVEEFGLGFPPRAKTLTVRHGTMFSLNWLPLGGFVRMKGEHDADKEKGSFGAASTLAKAKIMTAGVALNFATALILFTIVALIGMPKLLDNQFTVASDTKVTKHDRDAGVVRVEQVVPGSPAERAGVKTDDRIVSVGGTIIDSPVKLTEMTKANAGKPVDIVLKAGDTERTVRPTLNGSSPYLGVGSYSAEINVELRRSTWSAPIVALGVTKDFTIATMQGLGKALKGLGSIFAGFFTGNSTARQAGQSEAGSQVSGPVGIFAVIYSGAQLGFGFILFIIAVISLTLAIMNVLPIPALDGGRLFVMLLYRLRRKVLTERTEDLIHGTGFAVLMLLFLVITIVDIKRFF
jgi:regulator of sigma E protease